MKKKTYILPTTKLLTMPSEGVFAASPTSPSTTMPDYSGNNDMFGGASSSSYSTRDFSLQKEDDDEIVDLLNLE